MDKIELIHQHDVLIYPEVLFNRPISGLNRLHIMLIGGDVAQLNTLNQAYTALLALGLSPECIALDNPTVNEYLPIDTLKLHVDKKTQVIVETASVIDMAQRANLAVLCPGGHMNSSVQILCEKVLTECSVPVIITDEALPLYDNLPTTILSRQNTMFALSLGGLKRLERSLGIHISDRPSRGIYNILAHIAALQKVVAARFICYDDDLIVVSDMTEVSSRYGVIHLDGANALSSPGLFIGLLAGLLAQMQPGFNQAIQKVITSGYLLRKILHAQQADDQSRSVDQLITSTVQAELA